VLGDQARRQPSPTVRTIAVVGAKAHRTDAAPQPFTIPAEVKTHRVKHFKGTVNGKTADERAYRFGMFMLAQVSKQLPGRFNFKSAVDFVEKQKLVHRGGDNSAGGYLIPEEFGTDLIDLRELYGVVRKLFKVVTMSGETRTDPRRKSGLTAYFVADGGAGTESNKGWDEVRLVAKELMVLSRYTANLQADAVMSIGDDLASEIAYAFSQKEDDCGLNGDGSAAYGGITGIRNKIAGATASLITGTGNSWDSLTLANFNRVVGLLPQYADSASASWVCHKSFYAGVMQKLELAAGGVTSFEIQQGDRRPRPMFLGYPVDFAQIMPGQSAASQIPVLLGDYTKAATFGDRQSDEIAFSEHASIGGESLFERKQIGIRGTQRFDINVHDVGDMTTAGPVVGLTIAA
jgi:HK97 family phage major capsid protein